jgi:lipid-A-disaccharide synthase
MQQTKHVVIVAGEESGDQHAAAFVRQLKKDHPDVYISGIGGQHMESAGVHLVDNLARFGVTGISEVIRNIRVLRQVFLNIKAHLKESKPDLLILVDCPGFNLPLAKFAKRTLGIRILYYISPQIWAWKAGRIKLIKECVDQMAVIFPFEKKLYENAGVPVAFVGHPLVEKVTPCLDTKVAREQLGLPQNKRLIALLPGSRGHEIERHMPVMRDTAKLLAHKYEDLHFVIPVAATLKSALIKSYFADTTIPYTLIEGKAIKTVSCSDCAVVASGTASLECALLEKPMCIIYKASLLTYLAASKFIRVKYLGLCNLLQNEMVVPELLQYDCNPIELTRMVIDLLDNPEVSNRMQKRLKEIRMSLSAQQADHTINTVIEELLVN